MRLVLSHRDIPYIPKDGHTTYINSNGMYVPSVTTVLKVIPKESLVYWANSLGWKRKSVQKELDYAADVGTFTHEIIEKIILGEYSESEKQYLFDPLIANGVSSFYQWWKENKHRFEVVEIEYKLEGDDYGGTCDCICKWDNKLVIFDFKTSKDFYFSMYIQLCAYAKQYEKQTGEKVEDVAILRVDKNHGNIAELKFLSEINGGSIEYYYHVFRECLALYNSIYILEDNWGIKHS